MKIVIISDTHSFHNNLNTSLEASTADMIIHCGDWVGNHNNIDQYKDFEKWFANIGNFKYRLLISGNHEKLMESKKYVITNKEITYLENTSIIIDGLKFYGSPYQPYFLNWAFNLKEDKDLRNNWIKIPKDVDILITHTPPRTILDKANGSNLGCKMLKSFVQSLLPNLKLNCFGHIHESYGQKILNGVTYINAANVNENYKIVNLPIEIKI